VPRNLSLGWQNLPAMDDILDDLTLLAAIDDDPICTICGGTLDGDPEDDPTHPGGPMCGECFRAREMDEEIWASDL